MVSSNFTTVRLSHDLSMVKITGSSDLEADISDLQVAVAAPKPAEGALPGADLAPLHEQTVVRLELVLPGNWTVEVPNQDGRFEAGHLVVLAGTAVHRSGDLGVETWIGCTTVLPHDAEKL